MHAQMPDPSLLGDEKTAALIYSIKWPYETHTTNTTLFTYI